jgi:hypothetical protein
MLPISTAERRHEPCRGQFVWRLCRADLRDDGRRLAGGDRITPSLSRYVWHPALFMAAIYMIVLSSIVLLAAR